MDGNGLALGRHAHWRGVDQDRGRVLLQGVGGDHLHPQFPGQGQGFGHIQVGNRHLAAFFLDAEGHGPGGPSGTEDETAFPGDLSFFLQGCQGALPVSVVAHQAPVSVHHRVHCADADGLLIQFVQEGDDVFFERDGNADSADIETPEARHRLGQIRHREGHIDGIEA